MAELKKCTEQQQEESCTIQCTINLSMLFDSAMQRKGFDQKWEAFLKSDPANQRVYKITGNLLEYRSEQLIPRKTDRRPPLLLVFGNPASHSVASGMFFSFEGQGREHRFWKHILQPAGILDFPVPKGGSIEELNADRRERMFGLDYESPFRKGMQ